MEAPRFISNREIILDAIVFLGIVIITIYKIKKRKKDNDRKWQNNIENENWTNEEKWVIIKEIQENFGKYKKGKWFLEGAIKGVISIPILIMWPFILWFCLYELITEEPGADTPLFLIIFSIMLLLYIFLFRSTKKNLDNFENNLLYKIIMIYAIMFIVMITAGIWYIGGSIICEKLKLNARLSQMVISFSFFFWAALWLYFITKINKKNHPKKSEIENS